MEPNPPSSPVEPSHAAETPEVSLLQGGLVTDNGPAWRDELSARLSRYRERRKAPPPRYPSLRLPFAPVESQTNAIHLPEASLFPTFEPASNQALALDGTEQDVHTVHELPSIPPQEIPVASGAISEPRAHAGAKIIEFPRFAWAPPAPPPDQLAEPVGEQLRILEVPDVVPPPPALGGITIEPALKEEAEKRPGIDIPLQSAPLGRRLIASLVDGLIITAASVLFGFIFWKITGVRPPRMQIFGCILGMLCVFWAVYQYLLIVYAASTPGLRVARLELMRFDGTSTNRSLRRWRVFASYLSAASLGMGYAWLFLDEDVLCWHDRISRTYLAPPR